jgi:hypothetical protein
MRLWIVDSETFSKELGLEKIGKNLDGSACES